MRTEQSVEEVALGHWSREVVLQTPSWLVSTIVHMAVLLVLAMLSIPEVLPDADWSLNLASGEEIPDIEVLPAPIPIKLSTEPILYVEPVAATSVDMSNEPGPSELDELRPPDVPGSLEHLAIGEVSPDHILELIGGGSGNPGDRGPGGRDTIPGSTPPSERAVALGLQWLARHQMPDGGWSFAHHLAPNCQSQCRNPGNLPEARIGATGLALLPFLGAGQTHKSGKYKSTVRSGLYFLVNRMKVGKNGGSLSEPGGRMYSHGIASIVLCEALAMTRDKGLQAPASRQSTSPPTPRTPSAAAGDTNPGSRAIRRWSAGS